MNGRQSEALSGRAGGLLSGGVNGRGRNARFFLADRRVFVRDGIVMHCDTPTLISTRATSCCSIVGVEPRPRKSRARTPFEESSRRNANCALAAAAQPRSQRSAVSTARLPQGFYVFTCRFALALTGGGTWSTAAVAVATTHIRRLSLAFFFCGRCFAIVARGALRTPTLRFPCDDRCNSRLFVASLCRHSSVSSLLFECPAPVPPSICHSAGAIKRSRPCAHVPACARE